MNSGHKQKIDGMAILGIHPSGKAAGCIEYKAFDFRNHNYLTDCFYDDEAVEQLLNQLPEGLSNCIVVTFFTMNWNSTPTWEEPHDGEMEYNLVSHTVVHWDYKESYRHDLSVEVTFDGQIAYPLPEGGAGPYKSPDDEEYKQVLNDIAEWEEFFDEDFSLSSTVKDKLKKRDIPFSISSVFLN